MTIVIERRGLESSNARGYFSLYYLSLIIYKSQKWKKSCVQDLRRLTDRKSKLAKGQL